MTIQSWSGGKDSTASIILEHMHGLPKSRIVFVEVMFDHKRNISGELPEHIDFVKNIAIPKFESWGYVVDVIHSESDYFQEFYHVISKSKIPERNGKYRGFFLGGMCAGNDRLKMRPLHKYHAQFTNATYIVGIAADESERLQRLKSGKRSLLAEYGYTEQMAYDLCKEHDLLSPTYKNRNRGGCWFCPNQNIEQFAILKAQYYDLWSELKKMSEEKNLVSKGFRYAKTFEQVEKEVDAYLLIQDMCANQMSFFEEKCQEYESRIYNTRRT